CRQSAGTSKSNGARAVLGSQQPLTRKNVQIDSTLPYAIRRAASPGRLALRQQCRGAFCASCGGRTWLHFARVYRMDSPIIMETSNPLLKREGAFTGAWEGTQPMTLQGTINKAGILLLLCM